MTQTNKILKLIAGIGIIALFAGCNSQTEATPTIEPETETETAVAETETVLNFYNWGTYIDPSILTRFEEQFGVTINYQTFEDEEEMLNELQSGETQYDLIVASDFVLSKMRQDGMLTRLNKDNIPNFSNLDPAFTNPVQDPGNRYCAPYQWGTLGIGYNIKATGPIEDLNDVFTLANAGRIGLMDSPRRTMELILLHLGYSPNTTNKEEIDEAAQFLKDRADMIATYHKDDGQDLLDEGELDIVLEWSGDIFQIMAENPDIRYLVPPRGAIIWTDFICIPVGAEHKALAESFINYLLEPEVGAALSTFIHYGTPNQAAFLLLDEADRNNLAIYPPSEVRTRLFSEVEVDAPTTAYYENVWADVLASSNQ